MISRGDKCPQRRARSRGASRRAAAAVELALVLPVLMTIVLGCVDFGRFAHTYIARTGAGFASMHRYIGFTKPKWDANLKQAVVNEMQQVMAADTQFGEADLQVVSTRTIESDGLWRVQVDVTYPFQTLVNWPGIPNQLDLRRIVELPGIR